MKKLLLLCVILMIAACDSPTESNGNEVVEPAIYRYQYEFKNDRTKDVTLVYCREYEVDRSYKDSRGKCYYLDSTVSTFDSVVVPLDSIVVIGSDSDTLMMAPQYLLDKVAGRFRAIEYGHGMKWLSDDKQY